VTVPWYDGRLLAFDIESTGVDYETDRIVTASIAVCGGGLATEKLDLLLDPGIEIPEGATAVHGISTEHARKAGLPAIEGITGLLIGLRVYLEQGMPLVAFNARFDLTMLDREARRYGLEPLDDLLVIDPLVLDKHYDRFRKGKRTLARACEVYRVVQADAHSADADALAAARVAWRMGRETAELRDHSLRWIHDQQVEWAAAQARSLAAYFREKGEPEVVEEAWPVVPRRATDAGP
jgi:DNA polymerase-3 subunit epsilon